MSDLVYLLGNLVDLKENILVPDINQDVLPVTDEERETYVDIDFDPVSTKILDDSEITVIKTWLLLMHPSLTLIHL